MGNPLRGMSLIRNAQLPYTGKDLSIVCRSMDSEAAALSTHWSLTCKVDGSFCSLILSQYKLLRSLGSKEFTFRIYNDVIFPNKCITLVLKIKKNTNLLEHTEKFSGVVSNRNKETEGGSSKTKVSFYGNRSEGALIVTKDAIKKGDIEPYRVTLAHYYAVVGEGNVLGEDDKTNIGLSVVVHVEVKNNEFDYFVEGPILHPSSALFYMFDQVLRTGIWNPMDCPHCASASIQRLPRSISKQSESEDNESSVTQVVGVPGVVQDIQGLVNNRNITGNGNGNMIVVLNKGLDKFVGKLFAPKTNQ